MRKAEEIGGRKCPKCGETSNQIKAGYQASGAQRCQCKVCKHKYDLNPKGKGYSEEKKREALRIYYSGVSGRGVGKLLNMSKANVYNWIKKTERSVDKSED